MKIERAGHWLALVLSALIVSLGAGTASSGRVIATGAVTRISDILVIEREAKGKLLAVGRLDRISGSEFVASVLGQKFVLLAYPSVMRFVEHAEAGQPVALFGEFVDGKYLVDAAIAIPGEYVQGVSKIYLRGELTSVRRSTAAFSVGALELDASSLPNQVSVAAAESGLTASFIGSQPAISGVVLVERFSRISSVQRSHSDASVGTGSADASVGTGSPEASVGTGSADASVGTGSADSSVATGSTAG